MKGMYKLCNFQFLNLFLKASMVCVGLLIMQIKAFSGQRIGAPGIRFEQYMQRSGFSIMFLITYILILVIISLSVYQRYFSSKSIYTMMSLPVSKGALYLSFILPAILIVLMLCFTQLISIFICHQILIKEALHGLDVSKVTFHTALMNNSIFLAFIRYDYLRLLLPLDLLDSFRSITLLICPVVTVIFGAFCERSRRYEGFILVLMQIYLLWNIVSLINHTSDEYSYTNSINFISVSLALTALCGFLSYKMLKRKMIV